MILINHGSIHPIKLSVLYPITDKDVDELISTGFGIFINIEHVYETESFYNFVNYSSEAISLNEFIETKLNPEQRERVQNYICQELEKLNNQFFRPSQSKSARKI